MKKPIFIVALALMLAIGGCGWLARHGIDKPGTPVPKTQICPDDPLACQ